MRGLSLNVMDIVQNSISAGATVIKISVLEEKKNLPFVSLQTVVKYETKNRYAK